MTTGITKRQQQVLAAITRMTKKLGFAPTIRELADELGIASTNGVKCHLRALQSKGLVDWVPHMARTLRLTDDV